MSYFGVTCHAGCKTLNESVGCVGWYTCRPSSINSWHHASFRFISPSFCRYSRHLPVEDGQAELDPNSKHACVVIAGGW